MQPDDVRALVEQVARGEVEPAEAAERWAPAAAGTPLRVPRPGTLAALASRHEEFLGRTPRDSFRPPAPLSARPGDDAPVATGAGGTYTTDAAGAPHR